MSSLLHKLLKYGPGTVGFGPGGVSQCILWLDADRGHPSAPPVVDIDGGSRVAVWYDKSGFEHHVTQETVSQKPLLTENTVPCGATDFDSITFDGADDYLFGTVTFPHILNENTGAMMFVVFRAPNNTSKSCLLAFRNVGTGDSTDGFGLFVTNNGVRGEVTVDFACTGGDIAEVTIPCLTGFVYGDSEVHLLSLKFNSEPSAGTIRLGIDGFEAISLDLPEVTRMFAVANEINIGRFGSDGLHFDGEIMEILVFEEDNNSTASTAETYLLNKWCV
jgi:hypothetical protein